MGKDSWSGLNNLYFEKKLLSKHYSRIFPLRLVTIPSFSVTRYTVYVSSITNQHSKKGHGGSEKKVQVDVDLHTPYAYLSVWIWFVVQHDYQCTVIERQTTLDLESSCQVCNQMDFHLPSYRICKKGKRVSGLFLLLRLRVRVVGWARHIRIPCWWYIPPRSWMAGVAG